jgi:hypothetical protein
MPLQFQNPICQAGRNSRAVTFYAERLAALRFQALIQRCQLAKAHTDGQRELLARRLDLTDARTADIAARLHSMGAP